MGWKEDLEAELAAEGQKLRDAGVEQVTPPERAEAEADALLADEQRLSEIDRNLETDAAVQEAGRTLNEAGVVDVAAQEQAETEADALKSQQQRIEEAGQTLQEAGVEYRGEADLNQVIDTVEEEGAPEVETAEEPEPQPEPDPEPEPEGGASARDAWQPDDVSNEDWDAYKQDMTEMEANRTPEEIEAEQQEMADYHEAEMAEAGSEQSPEVAELETDDFEAWADSKAPAAPEQGQEIEQDAPEPAQTEMSFDEER